MRQMFIDFGMVLEGCEVEVIVVDTDLRQYARSNERYLNIETAVDCVSTIALNVNVDVVYADKGGLGEVFIELLDKKLMDNHCPTIIDAVKQVSPEVLFRPREVINRGHKIETAFDY